MLKGSYTPGNQNGLDSDFLRVVVGLVDVIVVEVVVVVENVVVEVVAVVDRGIK
jgi:hypothetical protein